MGVDNKQLKILRGRLDQLEYREFFNVESSELVYRLLEDLVKSTETCRSLKGQLEQASRERATAVQQIEPLKVEMSRLTSENNQLHLDLIHSLDDKDAQQTRFDVVCRNYEKQISDLKFVLTQYKLKNTEEQKKVAHERSKVAELFTKQGLFEKNQAVKLRDINDVAAPKLQKIDLETGLEPMNIDSVQSKPAQPNPLEADLVRLAETRSEMLSKQVENLNLVQHDLQNDITLLKTQISQRDNEIKRLGTQLEVARTQQFAVTRQSPILKYQPIVVKSGGSVDDDEKLQAQSELPQAQLRIQQLETHVDYLQEHIGDLENEAATFERERRRLKSHLAKESDNLQSELQRERERNATLVKNLNKLEKLVADLQRLSTAKQAAAKRSLASNETKTTESQKEKNQILALKSRILGLSEQLGHAKKRLQQSVHDVEQLLGENKSLKNDLSTAKSSIESLNGQLRTIAQQLSEPYNVKENVDNTEALAKENWLLKKSTQVLSEQLKKYTGLSEGDLDSEKMQLLRKQVSQLESELKSLKTQKAQLEAHVAVLEKEQVIVKQQYKSEQGQLLAFQATITKLRSERETAKVALDEMNNQFGHLSARLKQLEADKSSLLAELDETKATKLQSEALVQSLRDQISELNTKEKASTDKLKEQEAQTVILKQQLDEKVRGSNSEKQHLEATSGLQKQLENALKQLESQKAQYGQLKVKFGSLEKERNLLKQDLSEKSSLIQSLEAQLERFKGEGEGLAEKLARDEQEMNMVYSQLDEKDVSIRNLEAQLEHSRKEQMQVVADNQQLAEQVRNTTVDLSSIVKENAALNNELGKLATQRDNLRANLQDAESRIDYLDQVISGKEEERSQIMTNYRKVIAELEYTKTDLRVATDTNGNLKMQAVVLEKRTKDAEGRMHEAEAVAQQLRIDLKNLEAQYNAVSRSLASAQRSVHQLESDQRRALKDAEVAKDLTTSLDKSKEELLERNAQLEIEISSLQRQLDAGALDLDKTIADYEASKTQIHRLEAVLAQTRESQRVLELELAQFKSQEEQFRIAEVKNEELEETQRLESEMTEHAARRAVQLETTVETLKNELELANLHLKERKNEIEAARERSVKMQQQLYDLQELVGSKEQLIQRLLRKDEITKEADSVEVETFDARQRLLQEWKATQQQLRELNEQENKSESVYKPAALLEDSIFYNYSKTPIVRSDSDSSKSFTL